LPATKCVRLEQLEEVRAGAYACQCAAAGPSARLERRATDEHRARLTDLLLAKLANTTLSPDQLGLQLEGRLADRSFVAAELLRQRQRQRRRHQPAGRQPRAPQYFALGAQFDSDAALEWLSGHSSSGADSWPRQLCRACDQPAPTPLGLASQEDHVELNAASNNNNSSQEIPSITTCDERQLWSPNWRWLRPLVLALQLFCVLLTLALIGLIFRVRKSRVSWLLPIGRPWRRWADQPRLTDLHPSSPNSRPPFTSAKIILVSGWLMLETVLLGALLLYLSVSSRSRQQTCARETTKPTSSNSALKLAQLAPGSRQILWANEPHLFARALAQGARL